MLAKGALRHCAPPPKKTKPRLAPERETGVMKKHRRGGLRAALQVILLIHVFVQLQLGAEAVQSGRCTGELDVDEVAAFDVTWVEGELAFAHVVDLLKLQTGLFHVFADGADEGVNGFFFAFGVEHDECLVFAVHRWCGFGG